jgi:hypothetical protein
LKEHDLEKLKSLIRPTRKISSVSVLEIDQDNLFPVEGDGDVSCLKCRGKGWLDVLNENIPASTRCSCVYVKDLKSNLDKIWKGLSKKEDPIEDSILSKSIESNLWITATVESFRKEFRHVAIRQGPSWYARVVGDVDLGDAWLGTAKYQGIEILDPEIAKMTMQYLTLTDIAIPPNLLIIRLGMKTAPFSPMSQVLEETLKLREHQDKPTWILDHPEFKLSSPHHSCHSPSLLNLLGGPLWSQVTLENNSLSSQALDSSYNNYSKYSSHPQISEKAKNISPSASRGAKAFGITLTNNNSKSKKK